MGKRHQFTFNFKVKDYYFLLIKNLFLNCITLGLYWPWSKVEEKKFLYQNIHLMGEEVKFHGKGVDILLGYLKFIAVFFSTLFFFAYLLKNGFYFEMKVSGAVVLVVAILAFPYLIHSRWKYEAYNTSFMDKRFYYSSDFKTFLKKFAKESFFLMISCFIYTPWYVVNISKHLYDNTSIGDISMKFKGNGLQLFLINLKGVVLTLLTLGIYSYWWLAEVYQYHFSNLKIYQNGKEMSLRYRVKGVDFLMQFLILGTLIVVTFGLAYPYVIMKINKLFFDRMIIIGDFNWQSFKLSEDNLEQEVDNLSVGLEMAV